VSAYCNKQMFWSSVKIRKMGSCIIAVHSVLKSFIACLVLLLLTIIGNTQRTGKYEFQVFMGGSLNSFTAFRKMSFL